ncbi:MAG: helix-turn-helix transcriptional regulator [Prolixibacteraceae bacterium]|jgi:AraC family transcriptional activator of pobA|nr:helix-turn-helix transcriptional regulator [Prolixibacteraceae bacterium]
MNSIPTQQLKHEDENVFFAFRTMEENHLLHANSKPLPHRHDFYTILLVKNACGSHYIDYVEHKMKPELVFFVSPGQVHQVVVNNNNPSGDILMFSDEFLNRNYISNEFITNLGMFSCNVGTPPLEVPSDSFQKLVSISLAIKEAFINDNNFKFDSIAAHLKLFLIECNKFAIKSQDENPQTLQSGRPIINKFRKLLNENFKIWHKVNEYSNEMNISPDYLNNIIKTSIGKTAKEMIFQRIILEAKRLGLYTHLSTKEVAYQLGYDDPSHFSKFFKKETKQSFTEFKAQLETNG